MNKQAVLQVAKPLAELYTIVIPDAKTDFDKSADLDFVTGLIRKNTEETLTNVELTKSVSVEIDGYPARRFEASGTI